MRKSSKPIVTIVKKQQSHQHRNINKIENYIHVTRMSTFESKSIHGIKNSTSALNNSKRAKSFSKNLLTAGVQRSLISASTKKSQHTAVHSSKEDIQNIESTPSVLVKQKPSFNGNSSSSKSAKSCINSKVFLVDLNDFRHVKTIGRKHVKNKKRNQLCLNHSKICRVIFILLIISLVIGIPVSLVLILSKTSSTISTMQTTIFTQGNQTNTSTSTYLTSITSTSTSTNTSATSSTSSSTTSSAISSTSSTTSSTSSGTTTSTIPVATVTIISNVCTVNLTGIQLIGKCNGCPTFPVYTQYVYNFTALGTSTRFVFATQRQNGYFALDNVSVKSFLAPTTEILINGDFETGDLTGWYYCNPFNGSNPGGVKANSSNFTYLGVTYYSKSGSYYYLAGSLSYPDYLSQTFATVIGQQYTTRFWYEYMGNGTLSSASFLLGV